AYVFEQQADGQWLPEDTLRPPAADASFGRMADLAADQVIVAGGNSAYIYEKSGGVWVMTGELKGISEAGGVPAVAISDSYAFAGFRSEDGPNGELFMGTVVVFERLEQGWTEVQPLFPSDAMERDFFGWRVDVDDNQLLVGNRINSASDRQDNTAYLFSLNDSGEWVETAKLPGFFGTDDAAVPSYALDPENVVIGNSGTFTGDTQPGEVIVYEVQNNNWQRSTRIQPSDSEINDNFGREVVLNDDILAVQTSDKGTYFYTNAAFGEWEETQILRDYYVADLTSDVAVAFGPDQNTAYFLKKDDGSTTDLYTLKQEFSPEGIRMPGGLTPQPGEVKGQQAIVSAQGGAYIFEQQSDHTWGQTAFLPLSDDDPTNNPTYVPRVALASDRAIIASERRVYLFEKTNSTW
ncbi:MAG: FG-GAP repeat protein, partial [Bacteroidota bacterium]